MTETKRSMAFSATKFNDQESEKQQSEESLYSPESSSSSESHSSEERKSSNTQPDEDEGSNSGIDENKPSEAEESRGKETTEQTEAEKEQERKEHQAQLTRVRSNVDYGTILAFIDMFGPHLSFKLLPFNTLETCLLEAKTHCEFILYLNSFFL